MASAVSAQTDDPLIREMRALRTRCAPGGGLSEAECRDLREAIWRRHSAAPSNGSARTPAGAEWRCAFQSEGENPPLISTRMSFSEATGADRIVREILNLVGLSAPNFRVVAGGVRNNAVASLQRGERYIHYDPRFLATLRERGRTNWAVYALMAHEIGHHLEGHTSRRGGSRPRTELEADRFAGRVLGRMGATLAQAQVVFRSVPTRGTSTHPGRGERLTVVREGWELGHREQRPSLANLRQIGHGGGEAHHPNGSEYGSASSPQTAQQLPPAIDQHRMLALRRSNAPRVYSNECVVHDLHVYMTADGEVYAARGGQHLGRRVPTADEECVLDVLANDGTRYCVDEDGDVYEYDDEDGDEEDEEDEEDEDEDESWVGECRVCRPGECRAL